MISGYANKEKINMELCKKYPSHPILKNLQHTILDIYFAFPKAGGTSINSNIRSLILTKGAKRTRERLIKSLQKGKTK